MPENKPHRDRPSNDALVQEALERFHRGDREAKNDLLRYARGQLERMARKMLRSGSGWEKVRRFEETDDVLQGTLVRMAKALDHLKPETPADFFRLASFHIQNELMTLRDKHLAQKRPGNKHVSDVATDPDSGERIVGGLTTGKEDRVDSVALLSRYLDEIGTIPAADRELLDLIMIHEFTREEAAARLGLSLATFKRRYRAALDGLHDKMSGTERAADG